MFTAKRTAKVTPKTAKASASVTGTPMAAAKTTTTGNAFLHQGLKKSAETRSGNDALKYSTTGNAFVDQFTKLGEYRKPRSYDDIAKDQSTLWGIDPILSVCFILYIRMITRIVSFFDGTRTTAVQRGAGLRHEAIVRMIWLHINHKDTFWKNIDLFIAVGSWKDVITMLSYDLQYNEWDKKLLDWDQFKGLIAAGLENPKTSELVKKYLPQIKSNSQCRTLEAQVDNQIGKWICHNLFGSKEKEDSSWTYKKYRQLKTSGKAHQWQQLISQGKMLEINFETVHGRALAQLVSSKFIQKHKLEAKYEAWIDTKPIAKYTGWPHELFQTLPSRPFQVKTLNSQFMGLVETAKKGIVQSTQFIVARDVSGSMDSVATGTKMRSGDIAKAVALFFSYMLPKGPFANAWIEFDHKATLKTWNGSTPYEKWTNDRHNGYCGSTEFQGVIDLICNIKRQGTPEDQFPTGLICISDGQFNSTHAGTTNIQEAFRKLQAAGFSMDFISKFKVVFWNVPNSYYPGIGTNFETFGEVENVFYFGGYDPSVLSFLTGTEAKVQEDKPAATPKTPAELFAAAMDQEVLNRVEV